MVAKLQRRRAIVALVAVLTTVIALVVPLVNHAVAQAQPKIVVLNPSEYSDDGAEQTPLFVSDLKTGTDESDDENENTYRVNAWTQNTPTDALVEFELEIGDLGQNVTIGTADRLGPDAFEFNWDIDVPDGLYTIRAILYEGSGIFAEEVARHERPIIINRGDPSPDATPTVDITYPPNGDQAGFYVHPLTGATNILVDFEFSSDTDYIEVFYSLSDPGDEPVWKSCASDFYSGSAGEDRFLCELESVDQGGQSVTAIAAMANDDDSGEANPQLNGSGDAVRIFPYDQDATTIEVDRDTSRANSDDGDWTVVCSPAQFATVLDQLQRPIGSLNIDAHAQGPSDQTRFFTGTLDPSFIGFFDTAPSANKEPDLAHGTELGYHCGIPESPNTYRNQGDHNRVGVPDVKHLESTGGTGQWGISLHPDRPGVSFVTFWADEDDDDRYCSQELAVAASVGFDEPAPAPVLEPADLDVCPIPTPPPPGGTASPTASASSSPPPEDPRGCTVTGTEGDDELRGTTGDDVICGLGGDDTISALAGDDVVHGDDGNDAILGQGGEDTIDGGTGVDAIAGGGGQDIVDGGASGDILAGGTGDDSVRGNGGRDDIEGNKGRDVITGGSGNDGIKGGAGDDIVKGGTGKDRIQGNGSPDTLRGGPQNDRLSGGGGPDTIRGGPGKDRCKGGSGRDRTSSC